MLQIHFRFTKNVWMLLHDQVSFLWNFLKRLLQLLEKLCCKTYYQSYLKYITNTWALMLQIQINFFLEDFRNIVGKSKKNVYLKTLQIFIANPLKYTWGNVSL